MKTPPRFHVELVKNLYAGRVSHEEYSLLRDQTWFGLQKWLKDGGAIPADPKLEAELVAPTFAFDVRGRIKVEPKDHIKARLRRSPDRDGRLSAWGRPTSARRAAGHDVDLRGQQVEAVAVALPAVA